MYLLTYEYRTSTPVGWVWLPNHTYTSAPDRFDFITRGMEEHIRNAELFERRGNDWIRIRPEER